MSRIIDLIFFRKREEEEKRIMEEREKSYREYWQKKEQEEARQEEEKRHFIAKRKEDRKNKVIVPLFSKVYGANPEADGYCEVEFKIWIKPETAKKIEEQIGIGKKYSFTLAHGLYPKKIVDFEPLIISYDMALDIASGVKDMDAVDENLDLSLSCSGGFLVCCDNFSGKLFLLYSVDDTTPKVILINTLVLIDQGTSSSSVCCAGMEYLSEYKWYDGKVLLLDKKIDRNLIEMMPIH